MYRPTEPFITPLKLYNPEYQTVKGVTTKAWKFVDTIMCSFKTYGGTEATINNQYAVIDTASIETWYRPEITAASQIRIGNKCYEVIGEPEDIEQRHQFMKFKVRGVKGGA